MYKVIEPFNDLEDDNYHYDTGDTYPRAGAQPTEKRVAFLAGADNLLGKPVIAKEAPKKRTRKKA